MTTKDLSGFSLARIPFWHPLHAFRRQLLFNGKPLDALVNGDDIDHVVELDSLHVIATNYDYFDGCNHWIYLLNDRMKLIDAVSMPDYFGFLQDVERQSEDQISFGYYGTHDRWSLKVEKQGRWSYSAGALLRRPNIFLLRKRYMLLDRTQGPKWRGARTTRIIMNALDTAISARFDDKSASSSNSSASPPTRRPATTRRTRTARRSC